MQRSARTAAITYLQEKCIPYRKLSRLHVTWGNRHEMRKSILEALGAIAPPGMLAAYNSKRKTHKRRQPSPATAPASDADDSDASRADQTDNSIQDHVQEQPLSHGSTQFQTHSSQHWSLGPLPEDIPPDGLTLARWRALEQSERDRLIQDLDKWLVSETSQTDPELSYLSGLQSYLRSANRQPPSLQPYSTDLSQPVHPNDATVDAPSNDSVSNNPTECGSEADHSATQHSLSSSEPSKSLKREASTDLNGTAKIMKT